MDLTRRRFVTSGAIALAAPAWGDLSLAPTPAETTGPFYPVVKPVDQDADLTGIGGAAGQAAGQVIEMTGRVMNSRGMPVSALIELWQANAAGRYRHPSDDTSAPLDPAFDGYALLRADAKGAYRFVTVKPGGYPGGRRGFRTPHLHFDISGRVNRIVTQMYFPDEQQTNASDQLLAACVDPPAVVARMLPASADGLMRYQWDIILRDG